MNKKVFLFFIAFNGLVLMLCGKTFASAIDQVKQFESLQDSQRSETRFADYYKKLKQNPHDLAVHLALGQLYAEKQLYELALISYRRALGLNPQYAEAHYQMSIVYKQLKLKDLEKAELQNAVIKAPQQDKYHYHLGVLYMKESHYDFKLAKAEYKALKKLSSPLAQKLGKIMGLED